MANSDYLPRNEDKQRDWIANFLDNATTYKPELPVTTEDLTRLTTELNTFTTGIANTNEAKTGLGAMVGAKETARKTVVGDVRGLVRKIQATPTVSVEAKRALGITVHDAKPTRHDPITPTGLEATGNDNGENDLKWKSNGNVSPTQYIIEALIGSATNWAIVGTTLKTKFTHKGATPGVTVSYRVFAQRDDKQSSYSNIASLYVQPMAGGLRIAA